MKKKIIFISLFLSILLKANIREYRPDLEKIDKYKLSKQIAGGLQEFNYFVPSYTYTRLNNNNSNIVGFGFGSLSYSYNFETKKQNFSISKNISEILDTTIISKYYKKLNEFYQLKDKKINDYNDMIDAYYNYIISKKVLDNTKKIYNNIVEITRKYEEIYELGQISKIDLENMKLKEKYARLEYRKNELDLMQKLKQLDLFNIDKASIDIEDINIYLIEDIKLKKYVDYQNEKTDTLNNINYYTNLKNRIDSFLPEMILTYKKGDNSEFIFSISKTINLADSSYIDNKINENKKVLPKLKYSEEYDAYNLLKEILDLSKSSYDLSKQELEIAKTELELGKISEMKYVEQLEKFSNKEIELIKNKINLSKYILERE